MPAAAAFNGGKSQFNPNFLGDTGEYPFLDLMKISGTWTYYPSGTQVVPTDLDTNGYPNVGVAVQKIVFLPAQLHRSGQYQFAWTGTGTLTLVSGATVAAGSSLSVSPCTVNITNNNATSITVAISSQTSMTALQFYHVSDAPDLAAGLIVGKQFKQRFATEMKFGVIRFLNWMGSNSGGGNLSMLTNWASRRPVGYHSYSAQEQRANIYAATAASATGAFNSTYALSFGSGAPTHGQTITFKFGTSMTSLKSAVTVNTTTNVITWTNTFSNGELVYFWLDNGGTMPANVSAYQQFYVVNATGTTIQISLTPGGSVYAFGTGTVPSGVFGNVCPTLNLNVTGAVPIYTSFYIPVGSSNAPASGTYCTAVYDDVAKCWAKFGGDAFAGNQYLQNGCPLEVMVQFAAELGMHPYFVQPGFAADPITNFYSSLATYVQANGPAWMLPRYEGGNELWNIGNVQTNVAMAHAYAYSVSTGNSNWLVAAGIYQWVGRQMSQLGQALATVYGLGNLGATYHVIAGVQTGDYINYPITSHDPILTAALYVSTQGGLAATPYVSHVCGAQYIRPANTLSPLTETQLAVAYNGIYISGTISTTGGVSTLSVASTFVSSGVTSAGGIVVGQGLFGIGVPQGTTIASFGTGSGFNGTYLLNSPVPIDPASAQNMIVAGNAAAGLGLGGEPTTFVNHLSDASAFINLAYSNTCYTNLAKWAAGLKPSVKMCGYEGGYSPDYVGVGGGNQAGKTLIDILRGAGKSAPSLRAITTANLSNFIAAGTTAGITAEFPSCFQGGGVIPSNNIWSVYENVYVPYVGADPQPQAVAISLFNNGKNRLVVTT